MIILPAIFESWRSLKDKSYKLMYASFELTPEQVVGLNASLGNAVYLAMKEDPFKQSEKDMINNLEADFEDSKKSDSQRLRGVLYLNWKQDSQGYEDFNLYKKHIYHTIIEHYKNKLD